MSKLKDLKNHKIKTIIIWPRVIIMTLFFCAFAATVALLLNFYASNVVEDCISECDSVGYKIFYEYDEDASDEEKDKWASDIRSLFSNVKSICILDNAGNILNQYGSAPDTKNYIGLNNLELNKNYKASEIYYNNGSSNHINISNGDIKLNTNMITIVQSFMRNNKNEEAASTDLWLLYSSDDYNLMIEYHYTILVSDIAYIFVAAIFIISMFIILTIYHSFSFINLFKDKRQVYEALYVDMVTGGKNWLYFQKRAAKYIKKTKNGKRNYIIIQLRMEKYRSYCAVNGVKAGENLVEDLYKRLNQLIDKHELAVHYERADFAIMLEYQTDATMNMRLERLIEALDNVRPNEKLYFSLGVVHISDFSETPENLYNLAGIARGMVTEDSDIRIVIYNDKMALDRAWNNTVENEMENALKNGEFKVFLQPKYTPRKKTLGGAEALIRWQRPGEERLVPPGKFIPIFERNGFITKIDDFMISEVSRLQSEWLNLGYKIVPVSINLSRVHFSMPNLAEHIRDMVDKYNTPHEYIELELTESAFFDDKKALLDVVNKLHEYGFKVSMDDFGAGYSSLNSLKELPLDVIKIDAEFFRHVDNEERSNQIVRATINLAKQLHMNVVAEGVEVVEQVDFLAGTRCDLIQGFYFARPMPQNDYENVLIENTKQKKVKE